MTSELKDSMGLCNPVIQPFVYLANLLACSQVVRYDCCELWLRRGTFKLRRPLGLSNHKLVKCNTATRCNMLQLTATHSNTLQHTTIHCNIPLHAATHCTWGVQHRRPLRDLTTLFFIFHSTFSYIFIYISVLLLTQIVVYFGNKEGSLYIYIYIYICTYMYIYIYIFIHIYIYIYTCMSVI